MGDVDSADSPEPEQPKHDLQEERFDAFWAVYPRKQGKGAALKAWRKIKPDKELTEAIIASVRENVERNPQWHRDNGQYVPNPATWLNQTRWQDEIPGAGGTDSGGYEYDYGEPDYEGSIIP